MNKLFRPLTIFLALVMILVCFSSRIPIRIARATYVEGPIDKDTVWTLVDSPFVVSNNIIVYPNATLTLEPAVEVRFGGNFSIITEGTLTARGTENARIKFTSNRLSPKPGDWGTILLTDDSVASLTYCTVEYGTSGITVTNGTLDAENNNIENIAACGIYTDGNNNVWIHNNNFTLNGDGITLAGNFTSETDIQQNHFFNNTHSGISLEADDYENTVILNNTLFANNYGFYVSTDIGTSITHNYVLNNTVGIFYDTGNAHEAHFNDIYDNEMGMDASGTTSVDATYNYWGDKSGPEHDSLNPLGKGNPVGGNGTNLNFIFWLTRSFEYENDNAAPTAILQTDKTRVAPDQNVTFIGTSSQDDCQVDQYLFKFGDGTNTGWITLSLFNHTYASPGIYPASLEVKDDFNVISQNLETTNITVQEGLTPLNVAVTLSTRTARSDSNVSTTVYVSTGTSSVRNANVKLISVIGGGFTPLSGLTDSDGHFTTIFTTPNVTDVSNIRIIATASMNGYADGSDYQYVEVLPPLNVKITADPSTIDSEGNATVKINVTDVLEEPVTNVNLMLFVDTGTLSATTGTTDSNGTATFTFQAPLTLSQTDVTITVTADKTEYSSGQSQFAITVNPRYLLLETTSNPPTIVSEATSTITVDVTYDSTPIPSATLALSSDIGGTFSGTSNLTDSNGNAVITFTAPQIRTRDNATATITVTAQKYGYITAEGQTTITITPKILDAQITAQPSTLTSETEANVTVHVTSSSDGGPVPEANVTVTSENGGNFSTTTELTAPNGDATFTFTAPSADSPINVTISASAQKVGYVYGQDLLPITVSPGTLTVEAKTSSSTVMSADKSYIVVYVTSNSTYITNASVTVSSDYGNFSTTAGVTDSNGLCTFLFNAPETKAQLSATITASATKHGFESALNQTVMTVIPETVTQTGGGWPLTTVLLIIIPLMIVVIVVVLIRLKVISISFKEEQ